MGRIFNQLLHSKLSFWAESNDILSPSQFGFRTNHQTTDAVSSLLSAIHKQTTQNKKLYCCFVDFTKAFDSIPHDKLWNRLTSMGVNTKIINILKSMYSKCSASVSTPNGLSDPFPILCGVRQGCALSPLLFSLHVNNLPSLLPSFTLHHMNLSCLMFADDLVLTAENPQSLQLQLNMLCNFWDSAQLNVNMIKTKIMQFGSSNRVDYDWHMKDEKVDVVDSYKYLGTWLHCKNNLQFSVKKVAESGANAIKGLIKRIIDNDITDIPVLLQLFQSQNLPILTYNAEIWGMQKLDCLNKLCLKFYKQYILRLPYNASNAAVYGELGLAELNH